MGQPEIKQALEGAVDYLKNNREEARYKDSPAVARLSPVDGLATDVTGPDDARMQTDMPRSVGGANVAPSPGWFLRAAEASCVATLIGMRAAQLDVELEDVEVTVDSESDDFGILGIEDGIPAGPLSTRIAVRIRAVDSSANPPSQLREIVDWAVQHCPVVDAVSRAVPVQLEVTTA
jgi:uncharacterized OsmC-like protein